MAERGRFGEFLPTFGEGQGQWYEKAVKPPLSRGMSFGRPPDELEDGYYPYLQNVRQYVGGELRTRPGLNLVFDLSGTHSLFRLNDPTTNDFIYVIGANADIFAGTTQPELAAPIESGFSGHPFTAVAARPLRTPRPWAFIADANKMRAVDSDGDIRAWGIAAPRIPPAVANPSKPNVLAISDFLNTTESGVAWNNSVGAGALSQTNRLNTTITAILYDVGTTGYSLIRPAAFTTAIQIGMRINVNGGGGSAEFTVVEAIFPAIDSTTIESIFYESGVTGLCTVQLANPTAGLRPNSLLLFAGTEYVRVLSITDGPEGKPAFRCVTVGAFVATNTVTGVNAFRCHLNNTHAAAETLVTGAFLSTINPAIGTPAGVGNIRHNISRNLASNAGVPFSPEDEIHIDIFAADPTKVSEVRIWIDVDPNTASGVYNANDVTRNYFFYAFTPSDLAQSADFDVAQTYVGGTSSRIQRQQLDRFNLLGSTRQRIEEDVANGRQVSRVINEPLVLRERTVIEDLYIKSTGQTPATVAYQTGSGREQWFSLRVKLGNLIRIGEDKSRTLKDVTSVMVNFTVTSTVQIGISSWWIGGRPGPDALAAAPNAEFSTDAYYYVYTGRNDETGDESNASPPTRAGVFSRRQQNNITLGQHPDTQVTKLDVYRYGGTLLQWTYIGTAANGVTPTFVDSLPDASIVGNKLLDFEKFRPFPQVGLPIKGTCNVIGNRVIRTAGDLFDLAHIPGTIILINGRAFQLYNFPDTTDRIELTESAGTLTGASFEFPNPIRADQPLPYVWGPLGEGQFGSVIFGCGDPLNPGILYFTNPGDPNSTSDRRQLEVTTPNEPLINGCIYDTRCYVLSSEAMYLVTPLSLPDGRLGFRSEKVSGSKGLYAPYALTSEKLMYFLSKDGINASNGGAPISITDNALYTLFPHDGVRGETPVWASGLIIPPSYAAADLDFLRLTAYGSTLYFDHRIQDDVSAFILTRTFLFDIPTSGWYADIYANFGVRFHYGEPGKGVYGVMGATRDRIGRLGGTTDYPLDASMPLLNSAITAIIRMPSFNGGDPRSRHRFGDIYFEVDAGIAPGLSAGANIWRDNYAAPIGGAGVTIFPSSGRQLLIATFPEFEALYHNIGLEIIHQGTNGSLLKYYRWQPSIAAKPEDTTFRMSDWDNMGYPGAKLLQGFILEADTENFLRLIQVDIDGATQDQIFNVQHNGQSTIAYSFFTPVKCHTARLRPLDSFADWRLFNIRWVFAPIPESSQFWETTEHDFDICGWKHMPEGYIDYIASSDIALEIHRDGSPNFAMYTLPATNGEHHREYLRLGPGKFKIVKFRAIVQSAESEFRLFKSTCFHVGVWGRTGEEAYKVVHPFGGPDGEEQGALV